MINSYLGSPREPSLGRGCSVALQVGNVGYTGQGGTREIQCGLRKPVVATSRRKAESACC